MFKSLSNLPPFIMIFPLSARVVPVFLIFALSWTFALFTSIAPTAVTSNLLDSVFVKDALWFESTLISPLPKPETITFFNVVDFLEFTVKLPSVILVFESTPLLTSTALTVDVNVVSPLKVPPFIVTFLAETVEPKPDSIEPFVVLSIIEPAPSATSSSFPFLALIEEFATWIELPFSNLISWPWLLKVALFEPAKKVEPSFVVREIFLPAISESLTSIPFAMILISPPEILPAFNAITLYVPSLKTGLLFNKDSTSNVLPSTKVQLVKSWVVNTNVPAVEIEPPPVINIPFGLDIMIAPVWPVIEPAIVDIPLRTLFKTAQLWFKKFKVWPAPTFKCPQSRIASPLKFKFALLASVFSNPV